MTANSNPTGSIGVYRGSNASCAAMCRETNGHSHLFLLGLLGPLWQSYSTAQEQTQAKGSNTGAVAQFQLIYAKC